MSSVRRFGLATVQIVWLLIAIAIVTLLAILVRSDSWLRLYKYTWAAVGIVLLLLVFVLGRDVNGARLDIQIGPLSGQPSELLKVILVVFLAGYLSENRSLLTEQYTSIGPVRLPPLSYLAPMVAMWTIALGIVVIQRDLGAALLFFAVFLLLLYAATARWSYVVLGLFLFVAGSALMYRLVDTVQDAGRHLARPIQGRRAGRATRSCRRSTRSLAAGSWEPGSAPGCRWSTAGFPFRRCTPTFRSPRWARSWG